MLYDMWYNIINGGGKMIISEFVENTIKKYGFIEKKEDEKFKQNLKMKISRTIKSNSKLNDRYKKAPKIRVGKTFAKDLDEDFFKHLETELKPYLLNFRQIDVNDYSYIEFLVNHPKSLKSLINSIPDVVKVDNSYQLSKFDKLYLMVETIFSESYHFNEGMYTADLIMIKEYLNMDKLEENQMPLVTEMLTRLSNPQKYYISKRK